VEEAADDDQPPGARTLLPYCECSVWNTSLVHAVSHSLLLRDEVALTKNTPHVARRSQLSAVAKRTVCDDGQIETAGAEDTTSSTAGHRARRGRRAQRERFVATLAHEIRQPLSTLRTAVEVIRLEPGDAVTAGAIAIMGRQISQMTRVVEDLVDASRWARGNVTLRKERLDLRSLMSDAVVDVAAIVAARGQSLLLVPAPEALWVEADPQRLHQVLSNLLGNAIKYTDPGGHISIRADAEPLTIVLRVTDTGRGMTRDVLLSIFDVFSQVSPSDSAGVGIGLSVAREIVILHEGRIEAKSAGIGQGSEFIVTLPRCLVAPCANA
jgi:signal transduction histidine kinase